MVRATVSRTVRTSPNFVTLTVAGAELTDFEPAGFDQFCRLFFRREGQEDLHMPTLTNNAWFAQYLLMRAANRPWVRNYTVRTFRRDALELDIEFALHGDDTPASAFASRAQPGEPVGLFDEGIGYHPAPDARSQLLVADESAVPAVLSILDDSPPTLVAQVYLEVPASDDIREVNAPAGVTIHWLPRDDPHAIPGQLALSTVTAATLPDSPFHTWVAGESALATGLRRYLVKERGVPKSDVTFVGYWRHGKAGPG